MSDDYFRMWQEFLRTSFISDIVETFGCSRDTAKSWKCGRITPKPWQIPIYLRYDLFISIERQSLALAEFSKERERQKNEKR